MSQFAFINFFLFPFKFWQPHPLVIHCSQNIKHTFKFAFESWTQFLPTPCGILLITISLTFFFFSM